MEHVFSDKGMWMLWMKNLMSYRNKDTNNLQWSFWENHTYQLWGGGKSLFLVIVMANMNPD